MSYPARVEGLVNIYIYIYIYIYILLHYKRFHIPRPVDIYQYESARGYPRRK